MPRGHAGERLTISRHLLEGDALFVRHEGREVRLHPVDLLANAHARRARPHRTEPTPQAAPQKTAAALAFEAAFSPLVGPDGGYPEGEDDHD